MHPVPHSHEWICYNSFVLVKSALNITLYTPTIQFTQQGGSWFSQANTLLYTNIELRLAHHLQLWPNINSLLGRCVVFADASSQPGHIVTTYLREKDKYSYSLSQNTILFIPKPLCCYRCFGNMLTLNFLFVLQKQEKQENLELCLATMIHNLK